MKTVDVSIFLVAFSRCFFTKMFKLFIEHFSGQLKRPSKRVKKSKRVIYFVHLCSYEIHLKFICKSSSLLIVHSNTHSKFAGIDQTLRRVGTSDSEVGRPRWPADTKFITKFSLQSFSLQSWSQFVIHKVYEPNPFDHPHRPEAIFLFIELMTPPCFILLTNFIDE